MMSRNLHREEGVAALTVMLLTSVLAVAGSMVVFSATAELEIGGRDRRAETAFGASEGGLDVATAHLTQYPTFASGETQRCVDNPLVPATGGLSCEIKVTSPTNGQLVYPATGRPFIQYTVASKAKDGPNVTRTLVSTFRLESVDVPYGFFVDGDMDFGGNTKLFRESILVNGNVTSRNKVDFDWDLNDPTLLRPDNPDLGWRFHKHRIHSDPDPNTCLDNGVSVGCAAVYANFQIFERNLLVISNEIHENGNNPDSASQPFRNDRDTHQTRLENGAALPVVTLPGDAVLELMDTVKEMARQQGTYLNYKDGASQTKVIQPNNFSDGRLFEKNMVVYIDADGGDTISWKVNLIPGSTANDSHIRYLKEDGVTTVGSSAGILVVRGGELHMEAGTKWSGSVFVPENDFRMRGDTTCTCTIYSKGGSTSGGNSTIQLTPEWFQNFPSALMTVIRTGFFECEPFQSYPAGSPCAEANA